MRKSFPWKEEAARIMEMPGDLACQDAVITAVGRNRVTVENYRGILRYTGDEILLSTRKGKVLILGKRLEIPCCTLQEIQVSGCILGLQFLP